MYFRDFRHQIEQDEHKLASQLAAARERFFTNLSVLQLQLPELAQQLRALSPAEYTLAVDRAGVGNCIDTQRLCMEWPPAQFMRDYVLPAPSNSPTNFAFIAAELEDSGSKLVPHLAKHSATYVLLYVRSLALFYASLHFTDWLPVLHSKSLFVQLDGGLTIKGQLLGDLDTLAAHGIPTQPYLVIEPLPIDAAQQCQTAAEHVWHFEQSLLYSHDCDPVLRRQTHKFQWQPEFRLQNLLINTARLQPMSLPKNDWTLILCGRNEAIFQAAALLPKLQRVVLLDTNPIANALLEPFLQHGIEVHVCVNPVKDAASQFVRLLNQLPPETAWFCRFYQADINADAQQLRQRVELELRYRVQPAMGIRRCLAAAAQASAVPQFMLTRRTVWPHAQERKHPLLLLGNGPSLGATITEIQQGHAKGYLIVSCGTTLATLYAHNITPHIHLELELTSKAFNDIDKDYLNNIHFIAPLGFQHQWREQFGAHSSFISDSHPVDELVPGLPDDSIRVTNAFPTVLNLALSLAGRLGAEQVWLAGFDLAFNDMQNHHAKGSVYDKKDSSHYVRSSGELISVTTIDDRAALTKREFQFAAFQAQDILQSFPNMQAYQLCHGLDLGAEQRKALELQNMSQVTPLSRTCTPVNVRWQRIPHTCQSAPYLTLFMCAKNETKRPLYDVLKQPLLQLSQARRKRAPAELWTEGLKRNLAALLLRLELHSLAELPEAHSLFTSMLEDLARHEASIL